MSVEKLRLMCLVWPDVKPKLPNDHIEDVELDSNRTVASLRKLIRQEYAPRLDKVAASDLVLWEARGMAFGSGKILPGMCHRPSMLFLLFNARKHIDLCLKVLDPDPLLLVTWRGQESFPRSLIYERYKYIN